MKKKRPDINISLTEARYSFAYELQGALGFNFNNIFWSGLRNYLAVFPLTKSVTPAEAAKAAYIQALADEEGVSAFIVLMQDLNLLLNKFEFDKEQVTDDKLQELKKLRERLDQVIDSGSRGKGKRK